MIRDTVEADAEVLTALVNSVCRERRYLASIEGFSVEGTREFIRAIRSAEGVHVVAVASDQLMGWCDIARLPCEGMRHVGRLGMGVRKDHRAQGVGRQLLQQAIARAFAGGLDRIELEVFATNDRAIRLYERLGFVLEGRKVAARKLAGMIEDLLLYAKRNSA